MNRNKLTQKELKEVTEWAFNNGDCPEWLESWASYHYADEIPYGTITGDTGTVDEWLCDRMNSVIDYWDLEDPEAAKPDITYKGDQ